MQKQLLSLQELVGTVDAKLEDVEETLATIERQGNGIAKQLAALEQNPRTPPRQEAEPEATPCAPGPIHSPQATRPHARFSILNQAFDEDAYKRAWGIGSSRKPVGTTKFGESARSIPDQKPQTLDAPRASKPPKMREPEDFDGTKGKVAKQWVTKAAIWSSTQRPNYESEESLVLRRFSFMKPGKAADWTQPHLERIITHKRDTVTT